MPNKALVELLKHDRKVLNELWASHWEAAAMADHGGDEKAHDMHGAMLDFYANMSKVVTGAIDIAEHMD